MDKFCTCMRGAPIASPRDFVVPASRMQDYAVLGGILEFAVHRVNQKLGSPNRIVGDRDTELGVDDDLVGRIGFSEYLGHVTESEDQFPQFSVRTGLRAGADG